MNFHRRRENISPSQNLYFFPNKKCQMKIQNRNFFLVRFSISPFAFSVPHFWFDLQCFCKKFKCEFERLEKKLEKRWILRVPWEFRSFRSLISLLFLFPQPLSTCQVSKSKLLEGNEGENHRINSHFLWLSYAKSIHSIFHLLQPPESPV